MDVFVLNPADIPAIFVHPRALYTIGTDIAVHLCRMGAFFSRLVENLIGLQLISFGVDKIIPIAQLLDS